MKKKLKWRKEKTGGERSKKGTIRWWFGQGEWKTEKGKRGKEEYGD